ncbi:MAG: choice-of-anchor tandem repeat NxxGxxAF-containing protein, partial [Planctomycetota bacterium]|nr:choice-of-anchor tandem repeat NxxGxxAF-containing protein [Planctomycetota bacterium]
DSFSNPVLRGGVIGFQATLTGGGVGPAQDSGIWVGSIGSPSLVAREGSPAPDTNAAFGEFLGGVPKINELGYAAFSARLVGPGVTADDDTGSWTNTSGFLRLIAREGDPAPGVAAGVFIAEGFSAPPSRPSMDMNNAGEITFRANVTGASVTINNENALWIHRNGALELVVREGDPVPPGLPPVYQTYSPLFGAEINDLGDIAFLGAIVGNTPEFAIWAGDPAAPTLSAVELGLAPNVPGGDLIAWAFLSWTPALSAVGEIAFLGHLDTSFPGTDASNNRGIWAGPPDNLSLVLRSGNPAPDSDPGVQLAILGSGVTINSHGGIALRAQLTGAGVTTENDWCLLSGTRTNVEMLVREGDPAPGAGPGVVFSGFSAVGENTPALNEAGQVAFFTTLAGSGVTIDSDRSLWIADDDGALFLIAREGDLFDVDDTIGEDLRTITEISFATSSRQHTNGFNDAGQVAFMLAFADGSEGIFVAEIDPSSGCPADLNGDGTVGSPDLGGLLGAWGPNPGDPADLDGDGSVGAADLGALLGAWGPCP